MSYNYVKYKDINNYLDENYESMPIQNRWVTKRVLTKFINYI